MRQEVVAATTLLNYVMQSTDSQLDDALNLFTRLNNDG
jgi:hypothetical protein